MTALMVSSMPDAVPAITTCSGLAWVERRAELTNLHFTPQLEQGLDANYFNADNPHTTSSSAARKAMETIWLSHAIISLTAFGPIEEGRHPVIVRIPTDGELCPLFECRPYMLDRCLQRSQEPVQLACR
ncbi:hypothetical protein [Bradyrhizobium liaoningense]|uniref:hypothetical protein n=1 Tax=Bradyrhizobium liaoningense TaxID=43992 RepID=UPI001BA60165|nr:hypothetical protein [Bradyrhizobium liaoningense]MBR0904148.1 hypothetical protein [Bradyrhizobium liaoningense]